MYTYTRKLLDHCLFTRQADSVLAAPVTLTSLGAAQDATPLQLLAAQLHSDDVILGLPWLSATGAVIDFAARSVGVKPQR